MQNQKREKGLSILKGKWAVAELQISYKPKERTGVKIKGTYESFKVLREMWDHSLINIQEQFCALFLNQSGEVIGFRIISTGKVSQTNVDIPLLISCALLSRSSGVIISHNHPSGNTNISRGDKELTWKIEDLFKKLDIRLIDHLVISETEYFSFVDNNLIVETKD